jgi:hypothetical protein
MSDMKGQTRTKGLGAAGGGAAGVQPPAKAKSKKHVLENFPDSILITEIANSSFSGFFDLPRQMLGYETNLKVRHDHLTVPP